MKTHIAEVAPSPGQGPGCQVSWHEGRTQKITKSHKNECKIYQNFSSRRGCNKVTTTRRNQKIPGGRGGRRTRKLFNRTRVGRCGFFRKNVRFFLKLLAAQLTSNWKNFLTNSHSTDSRAPTERGSRTRTCSENIASVYVKNYQKLANPLSF